MPRTVTVSLADLEGIPHGANAGTSVTIEAAYTSEVVLLDGTIIPTAIKQKGLLSTGLREFSITRPSERAEPYRNVGIKFTAKVQNGVGARKESRWERVVVMPSTGTDPIALGNLIPAENVAGAQWMTVDGVLAQSQAIADQAAAQGQQLLADSAVVKTDSAQVKAESANILTLAQQAQAASLEVPDTNVASVVSNPVTQTSQALAANTLGLAQRTDYVEMGRRFSPYRTLQLRKVSAPHAGDAGLEVSCIAEDGRHVTYVIANSSPGNYRIIASVWEGVTSSIYQPDPAVDVALDKGAYDFTNAEAVKSGTFTTSGTIYTTAVGAYIESPTSFAVTGGSLKVSLRTYNDNRGGIWRLSIVDKPELGTFDVSTWAASGALRTTTWTLPTVPNGNYKVRATFQGADPANAPTGGTARGWLTSDTGYVVRASIPTPTLVKTNGIKPGFSNPDFAVLIRPAAGGTYRFVPWHNQGEVVESQLAAPAYYDGTTPINVDSMAIGDTITLKHGFEIVQRITGRNVTGGPDLISVTTKQRITPDGTQSVEGAIRVLADIQVSSGSYVLMQPLNPVLFDRLVSSWGNAYNIDSAQHAANTRTILDVERNRATSYAAISAAQPDLFAAVRFNDPSQSFHIGQAPLSDPMWIEHRNNLIAKLYPRIGYDTDTVVPTGTVWRFSGDYWTGRLPGIAYVVAP